MEGVIKKGIVLSIEGNNARVAPMNNIDLVSPNIKLAEYIDADVIVKGASVAYVIFEDMTGLIFARLE